MTPMTTEPSTAVVEGSGERRQRFAQLVSLIPHAASSDLLLDHCIAPERFEALHWYVRQYISAVLESHGGVLSEAAILERLSDRRVPVPNRTPNGLLVAKAECTLECNLLHRCLVDLIMQLGFHPLTEGWQLPINVRAVNGQADPAVLNRPYASSKPHSDAWAGEPADVILVNIPVLGDIARTTIEWSAPPLALGEEYLKTLPSFDEGAEVVRQSVKLDITAKVGHLYCSDVALLHQTVRRNGGCRVSLDWRFRMKTSPAYRAQVERLSGPMRLGHFVPFELWRSVGRTSLIVFEETLAESRYKYGTTASSYGVETSHRIVELLKGRPLHDD